jgi:hypothetical protein
MLRDNLARHVALHYALGFRFRTQRILLRSFVAFAEAQGDRFITSARVLAWAIEAPSPEQRRNRLLNVRRFAIAMHAEDRLSCASCSAVIAAVTPPGPRAATMPNSARCPRSALTSMVR